MEFADQNVDASGVDDRRGARGDVRAPPRRGDRRWWRLYSTGFSTGDLNAGNTFAA